MSPLTRPGTTTPRALWIAVLLVVLVGLLGMHGLGSHGVAESDSIKHTMGSSQASGDALDDHSPVGSAIDAAGAAMADSFDATGEGAMDMSMVAMCMAILGLALFSLARLVRSRGVRLLYKVPVRLARALEVLGRDRDPPSLIHLSIQRC